MLAVIAAASSVTTTVVGQSTQQYTSEDKHCEIILTGQHYSLNANEASNPSTLTRPLIQNKCSANTSLHYTDYTYTLAGDHLTKPDHYFNWKNWNIRKKKGDGGVDVTGAPNTILVEGANSTLFNVTPGGLLRLSIAIPAEGFVNFDLSNIGGSNILPQVFHNGKAVKVRNNSIMTSLLLAGDTLTINLHPSSNDSEGVIKLSNFEFHTNAISIIHRNWVATDENGNITKFSQLISLHQPSLADVVFPENLDGLQNPVLFYGAVSDPSTTGYPVFDQDKDLSTTDDQLLLTEFPEGFEITWKDEKTTINGTTTIIRHWSIKDSQLNNKMENSQIIKFSDPSSFSNFPMSLNIFDQNYFKHSTTTCMHMQVLNLYSQIL